MMNKTGFNIMSIGKVMKSRGLVVLPTYFSSVSHAEKVCSHAKRETPLGIRLSNLSQVPLMLFIFLPGQTFHKEKLQPNIKQLRDAGKIPKSLLLHGQTSNAYMPGGEIYLLAFSATIL